MFNDLFGRMQYEPAVLMFGNRYRTIDRSVLDYHWNAVVTTNCEMELSATLINDRRKAKDVFCKEDMQANLMDTKNLHVIRLFADKYPSDDLDELGRDDVIDQATGMLSRMVEIVKRNGLILIEDFEEPCFTHKELRLCLRSLYSNQHQVYIFNCKNKDNYLSDLEKQGIAVITEKGIGEFFEEYLSDEEYEETDAEQAVQIYIEADKKTTLTSIDRRELIETSPFATLLNVRLLNKVRIPQGMYEKYFYLFLKNSIREPQWFGYRYGFNLKRDYEDELYKKVIRGLENVGKPNNKPLLVVGQTNTGKSISLAAVAYRIFEDRKYPVVFINDPEVNFNLNLEYKNKEINLKKSPAFNALDALLEKLENLGARASLLIWDTSSYSTGRDKSYRLYQALLARGRKVYLLSTAYELNNWNYSADTDDENVEESVMNKRFVECKATTDISDEIDQLRTILQVKCNMPEHRVDEIINYYARPSSNYISMLYQAFDLLRGDLSKGVYKEANANLQGLDKILDAESETISPVKSVFTIALEKIEGDLVNAGIIDELSESADQKQKIEIAKDDFIKCIAVCAQFKLKMPYDFALRILGTYNEQIIRTLTKSTFFVITQDYHENYEITLRTRLEAQMYLQAKGVSASDEVDCVVKMLQMMNPSSGYGQQEEVRLCGTIIRLIGPNSTVNSARYRSYYPEIISALEDLRENRNIWEPVLITQEITYLREVYGRDENRDNSERICALNKAIQIADSVLDERESSGISKSMRDQIIVESANSKRLLYQLMGTTDPLLFKDLKRDLRSVIKYDGMNYHAYVTLLKVSLTEYDNESDTVRRIELLESMCSVADEITFENPDIADSEYFQRQVTNIYSRLEDPSTAKNYIEELVSNGSSAGLYVMARKMLLDNRVDFKKPIVDAIQQSTCERVYSIFNNERYKAVLLDSEPCQYMYLNVVWLLNNKKPMYQSGECWMTKMNESAWRELLDISNNFIQRFCNDSETSNQMAKNIRYIKALCLAELGQYADSISVLRSIEEDSRLGLSRVLTKHMICDENGVPRKFNGRIISYDEIKRTGKLEITEFGHTPIYFFGPHLKTADFSEKIVFNDIEIGYGNVGPKAFRDVEVRG